MEKNRFITKRCDLMRGARKNKMEGAFGVSMLATCCLGMHATGHYP